MLAKRTVFLALALLAIWLPPLSAQSFFRCTNGGSASPMLRSEGWTELTGDFVLNCTGGVPGRPISADITLFLNTAITSRILSADGTSGVLLLIGEPPAGSQVPGTNVFQGKVSGNWVTFSGVSFLPPGTVGSKILRITNVRVNAIPLSPGDSETPRPIVGVISTNGPISLDTPDQTLGYVAPPATASVRARDDSSSGAVSLSRCTARGTGELAFNVKFTEPFATAFKKARHTSAQNVPGLVYNTESGYFDTSLPAGLADQGTRLTARFSNIPAGVSLYVTVKPSYITAPSDPWTIGFGVPDAHLTLADANGAGPYQAVSPVSTITIGGASVGIAPVALTNGSGTATWEILDSNLAANDSLSFGVVVSYDANVPPIGIASVTLGVAPMYPGNTSPTYPIPHFAQYFATTLPAFTVNGCGPACAAAPAPRLWFDAVNYTSNPITSGDLLLVGAMSTGTYQNGIGSLALPTAQNQVFCDPLPVGPGRQALAYVPTAAERSGDFHEFSGVFLEPATSIPFPGGILPAGRIPATFAWRLAAPPNSCSVTVNISGDTSVALSSASTRTIDVTASNATCGWGATSDVDWLTLSSGRTGGGIGSGSLTYSIAANNTGNTRVGTITAANQLFRVTQSGTLRASKIGAYGSGYWVQDLNGNLAWDGLTVDRLAFFSAGQNGEVPVRGDWNGDGREKLGVYANGIWIVDYNGNGLWDGAEVDKLVYFGGPGWTPVVGDWTGNGKARIGAYRDGTWVLDYDGSYTWNPPVDKLFYFGGPGYVPLVGDWRGDGYSKIGVYKDGLWLLDYDGDFAWTVSDRMTFFGGPGYTPVVGNWNGGGTASIAAVKDGLWVIDNGNFQWEDTFSDKLAYFGGPGWTPVAGDWDGSGVDRIGAYKDGTWVVDYNGSYTWEIPPDKLTFFGGPGQIPVVGKW